MHFGFRGKRPAVAALLLIAIALAESTRDVFAFAAELTLRDGTVLRGTVEQEGGLVRLDDGLRVYVFSAKILTHLTPATPLTSFKPFRIPQILSGRNQNERIDNLVSIVAISPFDEFGRRTFSVRDPTRGHGDIPQGITEITP